MAINKLSLPLPVTQTQEPAETALAVMGNLCRCTQDRVADTWKFRVEHWEQGGWATHDATRVGVGNAYLNTSVPSLNSWQATSHLLREKSSVKVLVTQLCLTLCNSMAYSPPGPSVHEDPPGKNSAMPSSRGSSWTRDWTQVSCIAGRFFTIWATRCFK